MGQYISLTPSPWTTPIWTTKWTTGNGLPNGRPEMDYPEATKL